MQGNNGCQHRGLAFLMLAVDTVFDQNDKGLEGKPIRSDFVMNGAGL